MYILSDTETGGVYAVLGEGNEKTVHMFEEEDDAVRYVDHLRATDYTDELEILEVDTETIAMNCNSYGYQYSIVSKNDLVIPPP